MQNVDATNFCQQWADAIEGLDMAALHLDTEYKALPLWDSLMLLLTVAMVEEVYGVTLRSGDFEETATVEALLERIGNKQQSQA